MMADTSAHAVEGVQDRSPISRVRLCVRRFRHQEGVNVQHAPQIDRVDRRRASLRGRRKRLVDGAPIALDGLWAIAFGNGAAAGPTNTLYFLSGPSREQHGLYGSITVS